MVTYTRKISVLGSSIRIGYVFEGGEVVKVSYTSNDTRTLELRDKRTYEVENNRKYPITYSVTRKIVSGKRRVDVESYLEDLNFLVGNGESLEQALTRVHPTWAKGTWKNYLYEYGYRELGGELLRLIKTEEGIC